MGLRWRLIFGRLRVVISLNNLVPKRLLQIAEDIRSEGGRAFLVGGFVRDSLLGTHDEIRDFDIEVYKINQEKLLSILSKHGKPNLIGKVFGVVHLSRQNIHYDFSFPRTESKTGSGHRAFDVQTDPNLSFEEAARRRDFTINAMGMELPNLELADPYDGSKDLKNKILRHVSEAFAEDSLRVLRAVQFAARFELKAAKETIELCKTLSLNDLSRERIEEEFRKWLLKGVKPSYGLDIFCEVGLQKMFFEIGIENNQAKLGNILDFMAKYRGSLNSTEAEIIMFAGLLCLPNAKPFDFLKKWIHINVLLKKVPALLNSLSRLNLNNKSSLSRCSLKADGLKLPAILKSAIENDAKLYENALKIGKEMGIWEEAPEPFLTGKMLLDMGFKQGPYIGEIIKRVFEKQLEGEVRSKEDAEKMAKEFLQ
jgi:tRNA nucleotidyltransferase (CCA-adding enzyme)